MRRGDGARPWLALAGVAVATALGIVAAGRDRAGAADADQPVRLTFQAVRCDDWSRVPGNVNVSPLLDDTAGGYLRWGPAVEAPVVAYSTADLPAGCTFADGLGVRVTSTENGDSLVPIASSYQPPGGEDGTSTTRLGETGSAGSGQLVVDGAALTPPQQAALAGGGAGTGGLWVAFDVGGLAGWRFANLRCQHDTYNADNREVLRRGPLELTAVCVLFVVPDLGVSAAPLSGPAPGRATGAPPSVVSGPAPAPVPAPSPVVGPSPSPTDAAAPSPPPTEPAPAPAPPPTDEGTVTPPPAPPATSPGSSPPSGTPAPAPAPSSGSGAGGGILPETPGGLGGLRPPALVPGSQLPGPAAPGLPAVPGLPELPGQNGVPGLPGVPGTARPPEVPLPPLTTMVLVVEVGGVTRGTPADRPGGARSPWVRPVVVDLDCGAALQRRVQVDVGQVPGFQVESPALVLPGADRRCEVRPLDDGVDTKGVDAEGAERAAVTWVDGRLTRRGAAVPVSAEQGGERLVRVNVMFAAVEAASPLPARQSTPAEGGDQPPSPAMTAGLAGLFALGLAGAVARARRPS